jgi:hypothetical protein
MTNPQILPPGPAPLYMIAPLPLGTNLQLVPKGRGAGGEGTALSDPTLTSYQYNRPCNCDSLLNFLYSNP